MATYLELDDHLIEEIDAIAGPAGRSAFVRHAVEVALAQERRWSALQLAAAGNPDGGHDWDAGPSRWIHEQRRGDPRRGG